MAMFFELLKLCTSIIVPQNITEIPKLTKTHLIRTDTFLILKATKHIKIAQHTLINNDMKFGISPISTTNEKKELKNAERMSLNSFELMFVNFCVKERIQ